MSFCLYDWPTLLELRKQWKQNQQTVVWSNGCFDLLHVGHIRSLQAAKSFGDILVIGLNSDASVSSIKGPKRPIVPQENRAEVLAALECVDAVVIFDESTPEASLEKLQPDVHCKGAEYQPPHGKPIPEAPLVESYGGRIEFIPMLAGNSTTNLIERAQERAVCQ